MKATALITGGSGGLGTAVTAEFLRAGWHVMVPWILERGASWSGCRRPNT